MKTSCQDTRGFTLIELLVVISIIALLVSILMPSLQGAKEQAKAVQCLANLRNIATGVATYQADGDGRFFLYASPKFKESGPQKGDPEFYFYGDVRDDGTVDPTASPFMPYLANNVNLFACPNLPWGSFVPQTGAISLTTNYGYNASYLTAPASGASYGFVPRRPDDIPDPAKMFVLNDSAMCWLPDNEPLQNSAYLAPYSPGWRATTHFRHNDRTQALCADGHAERFGQEGGVMMIPKHKLGWVGRNMPHYAQ